MSLQIYFEKLIQRVEDSDEISNAGKDDDGFYKSTRTILLRHLNILRDLHGKPLAKKMVQVSWEYVVAHVPAEWLVLTPEEKVELKKMLQ